jgi:predicted flap endonuclease-1-like 5' DNA nuclease
MFDELKETGTVDKTLSDDDRQVRDLYEREVLTGRRARRSSQRDERRKNSPLPQGQVPVLASAAPEQTIVPLPRLDRASTSAVPSDPPVVTTISPVADTSTSGADTPGSKPLARLKDRIRDQAAADANAAQSPLPVSTSVPVISSAGSRDTGTAQRVYLTPTDELEAAPSIGPKTAARFEKIGIITVADFLDADPEETANALATRHITAKTIVEWQHQAQLVCTLPGIRGGHAQLLVGAGLTSIEDIASTDPGDAAAAVLRFAQTSTGQSILRDGQPPDLEKIHLWVQNAKQVVEAA